ncbi:hypothetical protein ACIQU6_30730 [Streptomyces sp. NPDC090442]|uniref:hypothetical protein n=1 Tax=Streptomyces sp. NPDC090442 TaxID=3365962 RepID=UPI0037FA83C8
MSQQDWNQRAIPTIPRPRTAPDTSGRPPTPGPGRLDVPHQARNGEEGRDQ